ncbi:hypothetical protein PM082_024550 [Marasmius tenuissimus]|nr:hypothetical protein PM082_024550 [Marasmius tenuissimus]
MKTLVGLVKNRHAVVDDQPMRAARDGKRAISIVEAARGGRRAISELGYYYQHSGRRGSINAVSFPLTCFPPPLIRPLELPINASSYPLVGLEMRGPGLRFGGEAGMWIVFVDDGPSSRMCKRLLDTWLYASLSLQPGFSTIAATVFSADHSIPEPQQTLSFYVEERM